MEVPVPWRGTRGSCVQGTDFLTRRHVNSRATVLALTSLSENKTSPDHLCANPGFTYGTPNSPKRQASSVHIWGGLDPHKWHGWNTTFSTLHTTHSLLSSASQVSSPDHTNHFQSLTMQCIQPSPEPQESALASWTVSPRPAVGSFTHTSQCLLDTSKNVMKSSSHNLGSP